MKKILKNTTNKKYNKQASKANMQNILLAFLAFFIVVAIVSYFLFIKFKPYLVTTYNGYAVSGETITENLLDESFDIKEEKIKALKVNDQDTIYKKLNSYYVGADKKIEINLDYPIYINKNIALLNLSEDSFLVTKDYEYIAGYPNYTMVSGILYNMDDLIRADKNDYIFIKNSKGFYINTKKITINTSTNEYQIPINSINNFNENYITLYKIEENNFVYGKILDIDMESTVDIEGKKITYKDFLTNLSIIEEEKEVPTLPKEEENNEQTPEINEEEKEKPIEKEEEVKYVKPVVTCDQFTPNVYTVKSKINIYDPSGAITEEPTFIFKRKNKVFFRKSIGISGDFELRGFYPDEKFTVTGTYRYKNEEGKTIMVTFLEQEFKTKNIDSLNPVKINFSNGEIFPNKIQLKDLCIVSDINEEAVKGIKKIEIRIDGTGYKITTGQIKNIIAGQKVDVETREVLKSNSRIDYQIVFKDIADNEIKLTNSTGSTITSKAPPSAIIKIKKQSVTQINFDIVVNNVDNVVLNNYRFVVYEMNGKIVKEDYLREDQRELILRDLNPNEYYTMKIYSDYNLEDGKGTIKDVIIGETKFTTLPLNSLGILNMNTKAKEVNVNNSIVNLEINKEITNDILIELIHSITINVEEVDGKDKKSIKLTKEQIESLKNGENFDLDIDDLKPNTKYTFEINSKLKQGNKIESIIVLHKLKEIYTLKRPAEVHIKNQFVTGNMIDFDMKVQDLDGAVLTNDVSIELRDEKGKLILLEKLATNGDYIRKTFDKLQGKTNYMISVYAAEYNEGNTNSTYKNNYLLRSYSIFTEPGISGTIKLNSLLNECKGKNLVDVNSEVKWYTNCFNIWGEFYGKTYDKKTGIFSLYSHPSISQSYVYDLREYAGKTVTMSFYAKTETKNKIIRAYVQNSKNKASNCTEIRNLKEDEWTQYIYNIKIDNTGYLGFHVNQGEGNLQIKELQIEESTYKTSYQEYKYDIKAKTIIDLIDLRNEIETDDYYINIYKNSDLIKTYRYQEIDSNNKVEKQLKEYLMEDQADYRLELQVNIKDRYYLIDYVEFNTKEGEIKGISTIDEYFTIQPEGKYIILENLDFTSYTSTRARFGGTNISFNGRIDYQGKTITKSMRGTLPMFENVGYKGVLENLVLDLSINHDQEVSYQYGLLTRNYGTIRNVMINIVEATEKPNVYIAAVGYANYGMFENFIINYKAPMYGARGITGGFIYSYGTIRNGYAVGENIKAVFPIPDNTERQSGPIAVRIDRGGVIENVYSLVNVDVLVELNTVESVGNVASDINKGIIRNIYSVGEGENANLNYGPTIGKNISGFIYDNYYFSDSIFKNNFNTKSTKLALHDVDFQNNVLNTYDKFIVDELVSKKYYPQLKLPKVMPNQEYYELPSITDEDLPDILSYKEIDRNKDKLTLEVSVHNPSGETVLNIGVSELSSKIISQEYMDGKSKVILELSNPVRYISQYNIMTITTQGAYNLPYTRKFQINERVLKVDFYKEINSMADWKKINSSLTENYILNTDLDFKNEGVNTYITGTYSGKLNGNGHTLRNINIPETSYQGIFNMVTGQIINLNIENYTHSTKSNERIGFIRYTYSGAIIDNVHMNNVNIYAKNLYNPEIGALVGMAENSIIKNSSVTNFKYKNDVQMNTIALGAMIGRSTNAKVFNSFVQDMDIEVTNIIRSYGVGGIIGRETGDGAVIQYCYTTGKIKTDLEKVGGICGYMQYGFIKNNYSTVDIESKVNVLGGICGYYNGDLVGNTYNLYLGNIYSRIGTENFNRITGNNALIRYNYAYKEQLINGFVSEEEMGATLLDREKIFTESTYIDNLEFGENFNYEQLSQGILPKIVDSYGQGLVANQKDIRLKEDILKIRQIISDKDTAQSVVVRVEIENQSNLKITNIKIEDMDIQITGNTNIDGITYIDLKGKPTKYYDSYRLASIEYEENSEKKIKETSCKIEESFYKDISSFEDWQDIDSTSYQNYRLISDIDFSGKINPNSNVSIGRLETDGNTRTLKNLDLTLSGNTKGLIREVKTCIKNINFENIKIDNATGTWRSGVIATNYGIIENVKFKDIEVSAPKASEVGCIGNSSTEYIRNVELENINIKGSTYAGGFVGLCSSGEFKYITANNVEMNGTSYAGGLFGNIEKFQIYRLEELEVSNSNINGIDYIGGIFGLGCSGYSRSINNKINGRNRVGGMFGSKLYVNWNLENREQLVVEDCEVIGYGNDIGGIAGYAQLVFNSMVKNTLVEATSTSSYNVGGLAGIGDSDFQRDTVQNVTVKNKGKNTGGFIGNSTAYVYYCNVKDVEVEGNENVGGIFGEMRLGRISYSYTDAKVTAYSKNVGGFIGYLSNIEMTAAERRSEIYKSYAAKVNIAASKNVGGLIGSIYERPYGTNFYYDNYLEGYLSCAEDKSVSFGIGSNPEYNTFLTNLNVYNKSTINGTSENIDNQFIPSNKYIEALKLKDRTTYSNIFKWDINTIYDTSSLEQNKYPKIRSILYEQKGIDLPMMLFARARFRNMSNINRELPKYTVYPVGVDLLNIEFDNTDPFTYMTYEVNGRKSEEIQLNDKVYTFRYDYNTPFNITINNDINSKVIQIKPKDISKKISSLNGEYFVLNNNSLISNKRSISGSFVNLYNDKAITSTGEIYNIVNLDKIDKYNGIELLKDDVALYQTNYNGIQINTYNKFTKLKSADETVQKDKLLYIKNSKLVGIESNLNIKPNAIILDNYNNNEYQTVLGKDKKLYDIKTKIKYPNKFKNENILDITNNLHSNDYTIMVYYSSGKVVVFDYITGELIYDNEVKTDISLLNYIKEKLSTSGNYLYSNLDKKYDEVKVLEKKLIEKPIVEFEIEKSDNIDEITREEMELKTKYITMYNPATEKYEIYTEYELTKFDNSQRVISENNKIATNINMISFYNEANKYSVTFEFNGIVIITVFLSSVAVVLIVLFIQRRKLNK